MLGRVGDDVVNTVLLLDVLLTIITFLVSFWARDFFLVSQNDLNFYSHLFMIPLLLTLLIGTMSYFGGYRGPSNTSLAHYLWAILRAVTVTVCVILALLFFLKIQYVSRLVILLFASLEICVLIAVRGAAISWFRSQVRSGSKRLRVLIVGSRSRARELVASLREHVIWGITIVGFVDPDPSCAGKEVDGIPIIGTVENIHECLKGNVVDEVIIAIPRSLLQDAEPIVAACEEEGIRLSFMADLFNVKVARVTLSQVKNIPLLTMEPIAREQDQLLAKRLFDVTLTILVIPFLLPLFLVIGIAIKFDSPGPVFFIQERVGMRKHIFKMFKFRSMYLDAEDRLKEIEHLNEADGPIFKMKEDPRITRVGKIIRKTSIDELPQLINVLKGDMSLVGPRPMTFRDVDLFDRGIQRKRFSVQPGITCIWQVSGRSDLSFEKWLELDLQYIDTWSFWLDLKILLQTIPAVIKTKGAA